MQSRNAPDSSGGRIEGWFEPRLIILFITMRGAISDSLIYALEREFPWAVIEQVEDVNTACSKFELPLGLILIDAALLKDAEDVSADILLNHPQAYTAAIEFDDHNPTCSFPELLGSRLVRGVLPMNLKLDVWLSVIRLMLRGGEYFPAGMFHSYTQRIRDNFEASSPRLTKTLPTAAGSRLTDLTAREIQILEQVSRGLQNKAIAAEFNLSEHTVKVHLHNIITKLGARNRTDAAARFLEREAAPLQHINPTSDWAVSPQVVTNEAG